MAEEDRKYFFDVERPFALKATEFSLKMAKEVLEYEQEELHQLEKMYKADDITEETEQIVLKRARDTVERAKFMVEATQDQPRPGVEVHHPAQGRAGEGIGPAKVAGMGEEQGGAAAGAAEAAAGTGETARAAASGPTSS